MKLSIPAMLLVINASLWAQSNPLFYQPLGQVKDYLQLSDGQLQTILTNNGDYDQLAVTKQTRISQLQSEIAAETAKDTLDPMALGTRYAEIETICRELRKEATEYQTKNTAILTDPQKAKLQVLQDAVKLAPVISDAQSGNLIGSSTYAPLFFTSTGTTSGSVIGGILGPVSGCYSPVPTAIIRSGNFTSAPANGVVIPANRVGAPMPGNRLPARWFDATQFAASATDRRK